MFEALGKFKAALFFFAVGSLLTGCVTAQKPHVQETQTQVASERSAEDQPPIKIRGFEYSFIKRGRIHMNICREAACVPGSKVSYILGGPTENPNFEEFKFAQGRVFSLIEEGAPRGATMTLGAAERTDDPLFTTFTSAREMRLQNGSKLFTRTTNVFRKNITMSVISSAEEEETAKGNGSLFLVGLLVWSQARENR